VSPAEVPPALCLIGPTASGKTGVAVELVRRFPVEIISVDSAMVYRRMDIGTAKPGPEVLATAPHHLIDIREPWEPYSAGDFCDDARRLIDEIRGRGRIPLLVGGTLLYFRALQVGLAPLPPADADLRAWLDERAEREGWAALHAELARLDPEAATRIDPADRQRIQRALEVFMISGEPISRLQRAARPPQGPGYLRIELVPGTRAQLYRRIESRFRAMMAGGLVEEVAGLMALPRMSASLSSMRAVGYRQVWQYLSGQVSRAEAERQAVVATRRLAKRQLTWLRTEPGELRFDCLADGVEAQVAESLRRLRLFDAI